MRFTADISRSNGEVLADIAEREIQFSTMDELRSELERAYEAVRRDMVARLKAFLIAS